MRYSTKQLSNLRWGIYEDARLLATLGCYETCLVILKRLEQKYQHNKINKLGDRIQIAKTAA